MIGQKKTALRFTRAQRGYPSNEPPQTFGESEMKDFTPHINPNRACNAAAKGGILPLLGAFTEGNLGGLQLTGERIAAPTRGVFLFGLSFDAVHPLTGAPCGHPSGWLFPVKQSANLRGVAHPLGGVVNGFTNRLTGMQLMSTLSKAQCIRAQRVRTPLNHLRATARAVRSAVNPYASLDRILSLSSVLRDAAANRRFSSFSNFSIEA